MPPRAWLCRASIAKRSNPDRDSLEMLAVLISERAARTVLSASVLFPGAGFLVVDGCLGWVHMRARDAVSAEFAELALFVILLVDGSQLPLGELRRAWHLPGRALLFGMPLTIGLIALAGHLALGMTWVEASLVGAILSPTDPVSLRRPSSTGPCPCGFGDCLASRAG